MNTLKVGDLGLVAGGDEGLEAGLDQGGQAAAEDHLLAEQIGLGLFLVGRLEDAGAGAADPVAPSQRDLLGGARGVLLHRDQARHAAALLVLAADQMSRPLRRDHDDVDVLRRHDVLEVDVEPVAEPEGLASLEVWGDLAGVDLRLHLVRQRHDDQGRPFHRGLDVARLEAVLDRQLVVVRPLQLRDRHLDPAVAKVLAVGMTLTPISDDCYSLAL